MSPRLDGEWDGRTLTLELAPRDIVRSWLSSSWSSVATISRRTGLDTHEIKRYLRELFDAGEVMRRPGATGEEWRKR